MTWTIRQISEQIATQLGHSGRRSLDSSYTVDALRWIYAAVKTEDRLSDWIPEDLSGRDVLVLDCGLGSVAIELARRGARVVGLCASVNEALICQAIAACVGEPTIKSGLTMRQHESIANMRTYYEQIGSPWSWAHGIWYQQFSDVVLLDWSIRAGLDTVLQAIRPTCGARLYLEVGDRRDDELLVRRVLASSGFDSVVRDGRRYSAIVEK